MAHELEVVARKSGAAPPHPPLLFVHGAAHGAWCWAEHFLGFFADRGFDAYALSLRGHGASGGHARLRWTSSHRTWEMKICDATRPDSGESRFAPCSS